MRQLLSLLGIFSLLMFIAAQPAAPEAPADGPDVIVDDGESPDSPQAPDAPEIDHRPMVDNPQYKSWADHGVGTSISNVANVEFGGQAFTIDNTMTLLAKTAEAATVETKSAAKGPDGKSQDQPSSKEEIAAKVRQGLEYAPDGFEGKFEEAGTETITVNGKSYDCRIMMFDGTGDGALVKGKVWVCNEVPGTHVKGEFDMDMDGMMMKFTLMLTNVTLK